MDNRQWALLCAALHHGLSNLSSTSKPARAETVVRSAAAFEDYLNTGNTSPAEPAPLGED